MNIPHETRAERKAAHAAKTAAAQAKQEALQLEAGKKAQHHRVRKFLLIFSVLAVSMTGLAFVITAARDAAEQSIATTVALVKSNYQVDDAASTPNRLPNGNGVIISAAGKVHTCRGIMDEDLRAKKSIICDDHAVIQPKP